MIIDAAAGVSTDTTTPVQARVPPSSPSPSPSPSPGGKAGRAGNAVRPAVVIDLSSKAKATQAQKPSSPAPAVTAAAKPVASTVSPVLARITATRNFNVATATQTAHKAAAVVDADRAAHSPSCVTCDQRKADVATSQLSAAQAAANAPAPVPLPLYA